MRSFLVGLGLLCICGTAFGQASGFVEKIGFGKGFRPYGWTPVLVNLTSTISEPAEYQIQVLQEDLDRDRVVFRRDIVLNPNRQEKFWVYFLAQPRGLSSSQGTPQISAAELMQSLNIRLCTKSGKPLSRIGIQDAAINIEPARQSFTARPGVRLVLMVIDGSGSSATPSVREFQDALGLNEDMAPTLVTPFDLPENVIGYDAVDAVVWLDADAGKMTTAGSHRLTALTAWVRSGGRLVVTQPAGNELFKIEPMEDMLPVELKNSAGDFAIQSRQVKRLSTLRELSTLHTSGSGSEKLLDNQLLGWTQIEQRNGPFNVAFAKLREGAMGDNWIDWKGDKSEMSPWLARRALGLGSVTWVAQDLSDRRITGKDSSGWPNIWDHVLGQNNIELRTGPETDTAFKYGEANKLRYNTGTVVDIGASMLRGMEHEGRAGGLVFLAGVFFVGYWVVAGPVAYLVLAGKKRTELSWSIFAVSAMVATLLTVGVVRLVLRGDAEVHHVSLVRMLPLGRTDDGTPTSSAIVNSRIGLYIPRDGMQTVALEGNDPQGVSYITPFSVHPAHQGSSNDFPAYLEYTVPVRDAPLTDPVSIDIPSRSTLKKLQARWVGTLTGGIEPVGGDTNRPKIVGGDGKINVPDGKGGTMELHTGFINGKLVNKTGADLVHVYFAFSSIAFDGATPRDLVLYTPSWPNGAPLDLTREFNDAKQLPFPGSSNTKDRATPGGNNKSSIRGELSADWAMLFWYPGLRGTSMSDQFDDSRNEFLRSFPMLSFFDRIEPKPNTQGGNTDRVEVLRRAAREWDISELIAAGQLVILAQSGKPGARSDQSPLPFPMDVEGARVAGTGVTFYQFALPLDHSQSPKPWEPPTADANANSATTQPATTTPVEE